MSSAARPGVFADPLDSSLTVKQVSQPQNANIEPDSPAMNADRVRPAGLNHSQLKLRPVGAVRDFAIARPAKINRIASWNPTSTN